MKIETNSPMEAALAFLTQYKDFYLSDLVSASGIDRRKLLRVLETFRNEGYLAIIDERKIRPQREEVGPCRRDPKYQLVKEISNRKPNRPERAWKKVWRTLRHLRRATRTDIIRLTGCSYRTVEQYTVFLARHGYIKAVGRRDREKLWFLVKDVGPKPPDWNEVYDGKK